MTGGPNGKAAEVLTAPSTAQRGAQSTDIVDDEDEVRKFVELQQRAAGRGYTLRAVRSGFVLQRGIFSVHAGDLITIAHALARMGPRR